MRDRAAGAGLMLDPARPVEGDAEGVLRDSMTLFYQVLGDGTRAVGASNGTGGECVHRSSIERMQKVFSYRPGNLEAFLKAQPPPRVCVP